MAKCDICNNKCYGDEVSAFRDAMICEKCWKKAMGRASRVSKQRFNKKQILEMINLSPEDLKKKQDEIIIEYGISVPTTIFDYEKPEGFIVTTGPIIENHNIVRYIDVICYSAALGTGVFTELKGALSDLTGEKSRSFSKKMDEARTIAHNYLIQDAIDLGANALIGISYEVFSLTNNMICIMANGTAVVYE